jgi:serine/threonine protein kinase
MPADPRLGATIAGYRIESRIARGGMSVVYLADDLRLRRKVALKLLDEELAEDDRFRERFIKESEIAASMDHPNIVPIFEAGEADGILYIAMRYVAHGDLGVLVRREGRLRPARALGILGQVASALDDAHARDLIHRDVKPVNVLIDPHGETEHAYLTDFGITKHVGTTSGLTRTGQFIGTVDYMAPEQVEGKSIDHHVDVYSLGCVLYECLTGEVPFPRDELWAVAYAHSTEPPPVPSAKNPDLPPALDAVIGRAMEKRPAARFESCGELIAAAARALTASPPRITRAAPPLRAEPVPPTAPAPPMAPVGPTDQPMAPVDATVPSAPPAGVPATTPAAAVPPAAAVAPPTAAPPTAVPPTAVPPTGDGAGEPGPTGVAAQRSVTRRGPNRRMWLALAVVLVVVAGGAIGAALALHSRSQPAVLQSTPPADSSSPTGSTSTSPAGPSLRGYVGAVEQELGFSADARRKLGTAIGELRSGDPGSMSAGKAAITDVLAARQESLTRVQGWDVPTQAGAANQLLVAALSASIQSDRDYLDWANALIAGDRVAADDAYARARGNDQSIVDPAKAQLIGAYNALRRQVGEAPLPGTFFF